MKTMKIMAYQRDLTRMAFVQRSLKFGDSATAERWLRIRKLEVQGPSNSYV